MKEYIGELLYAEYDGRGVLITALSNQVGFHCDLYLSKQVWQSLVAHVDRMKTIGVAVPDLTAIDTPTPD